MNIYQQELLDHFHNPRHKGQLSQVDFACELHNPSCGDSISWQGCLHEGLISSLAFQGKGCVISQAVASMLAQQFHGQSIQAIQDCTVATLVAMIGIDLGPTRLKCALLPLQALQKAVSHQSL
ncbi:MAG TPA: iron-sulfur cluster assembly scaffold protein [Candidatus Babeliales bacterium]|nr:iron-sulfur cluster assembly scaffold protein [Candidatus Babeliales bacterium]